MADLNNDGDLEIIVNSTQRFGFPTQLVVLNNKGDKIGEYWNSGRIVDILFADLNEDKKNEIILGAMNNEYERPSLIVFESNNIQGSSPQKLDEFKCVDLELGTEKYYMLFPKVGTEITGVLMESMYSVVLLENQRLKGVTAASGIIFEMNFALGLEDIQLSHHFELKYEEAFSEGKIKTQLNKNEYTSRLGADLLYFNGSAWVNTPAMSNPWGTIR